MKIYDTITIFNELDLLEMRLEILDKYVDYFVINEATTTFTGKYKPLYYEENKNRFKKFKDKIIHNIFEENNKKWTQWDRDRIHKNASMLALKKYCNSKDIVFYSDADEIPNFENINLEKIYSPDILFICHQDCYYYYLNTIWEAENQPKNFWRGTKFSSWELLKKHSIDTFRDFWSHFYNEKSNKVIHLPNCGWHFSFLGGEENIKYKLDAYGHQELNIPIIRDNIKNNIKELKDPFLRKDFKIRKIDITEKTHPKYLIDNLEKYKNYILE
jgi:beta-1,4-mannosyl-glycoprotein beta-1,4-N-acetylglucosaminyltransferase